ncbi:MAG: 30S ribosomal protein S6 [Bacteroidota bacterium]|nr:30S ribosomal protein S6 [Candidatus Kapabacteria bacterium]MCS7302691.1 30S ribosomal protein S6 [Candidatus Kapabacteria bacterium]MCX7936199.1 30S ribosomal protein S6 [Chlorobiota bacterium]MDW8074907.1 30S ribosomal protein S6 [Bacteroidota bacterium]MDW8271546.1 30S ribosomal protein S6 [Bacteroidota bacterium]
MSNRRLYETTYILNAALEDPEIEEAITRISEYIEHHGGTIREINRWGRRRMAYAIKKKYNGYYVHCIFEAPPNAVPIIERYLLLDDSVLRHLTLQLSQRLIEYRKNRASIAEQQSAPAAATGTSAPTSAAVSETTTGN